MQILPRTLQCVTFLATWILFCALPVSASAGDLRENAFFKALEGTWKGEGLGEDQEGKEFDLKGKIKAGFTKDGSMFTIDGSLIFNEMELEYQWQYTEHSIEGLYSAKSISANGDETLFDASVDETSLFARLTQTSGLSSNPRLEIEKKIVEGKYQTKVLIIDPSGDTTFTAELKFEKE